jgi:hypothetical protein
LSVDFAFTNRATFGERREIEEAEVHRLLHFENKGRRDENERRMSLHETHAARTMRIGFWIAQKGNERLAWVSRGA